MAHSGAMHPQTKPTAAMAKHFDAPPQARAGLSRDPRGSPVGTQCAQGEGEGLRVPVGRCRGLSISVKLPESNSLALTLPFAEPTGYGLGKSGWVSAKFASKDRVPLDLLFDWLEESFRAIAPKRVVAGLAGAGAPARRPKKTGAKKTGAKKTGAMRRRV